MANFAQKLINLSLRKARVRAKVTGTSERPRLSVTISNKHISAQIIDDVAGKTLAAAASNEAELSKTLKNGSNIEAAKLVGETIGKRAVEAGISEVIFDRGGRIYHGRVQALADGARGAGLKF